MKLASRARRDDSSKSSVNMINCVIDLVDNYSKHQN